VNSYLQKSLISPCVALNSGLFPQHGPEARTDGPASPGQTPVPAGAVQSSGVCPALEACVHTAL
jgi:hypothetical protein